MKTKVFIAVPTTGSVVDSQEHFLRDIRERYKDEIEFVYPKNLVRRVFHDFARNALVEDFIDSGADIMWFLDSDVTPPLNIMDLVTQHKDKWELAGAVYPVWMKPPGFDSSQIVFTAYTRADNGQYIPKPVIPQLGTEFVDGLATGCLLIKREVLTSMQAPYFQFSFDPKTRCMSEGEDFYFIRQMNAGGKKFFTDYSMVCKHQKTVDLLDINNYAIQYANRAIAAYDRALREQLSQINQRPRAKSSIILPQWSR